MAPGTDKDGFDRQIEITYQKLEGLLQRMSSSGEEASIASEAIEELSTSLEELHVASDELSRQNTQLAAAQLAVQAERQRYQDLFDFAPDGYLVTDTNGVIREANKAAADLLHVSRERLVGKPLAVYVTEAERKAFRDILNTLLKRAITGANEWEIGLKPRTGKELRASITVAPVVPLSTTQQPAGNEATDGVGLRWSLRDITESKRAEERERLLLKSQRTMQEALKAKGALQESEARYRALIENSPDLITRFDREMRMVFANPATVLRTGRTEDMLMGRTPQEYGAAQTSTSTWEQYFQRVLETGKTQHFENTSIWQGQARTYDTLAVPEFGADGSVTMVMLIARDISEKRQVEQTLRKNEADLRAILDATKESIWMFDPEGSILMGNETALKRLNHSAEEVIGQPFSKFMPAELAQARQACLRKVVESGQPVELEDERTGIIFHHIFYPVKDGDGHVVRIAAFSQDITEPRRADEALQTTLQRFYNVLSSMYTALLLVTDESRVEYANQAFCDYFELKDSPEDLKEVTASEILAKIKPAYLHPDEALERIQEIVARGEPVKGEDVPMRSGRELLRDFIPIQINGKSYGRLWQHTDISERIKIEQALQDSELKYRSLVKFAPAGIYEVDFRTGRFTEVNDAMCQILGYTREELLGMTAFNILDDEGKALFAARIRLAQNGDQPTPATEYRVRTKDGRLIWALLNITFHREGGKIVGATVIANDITERRLAEEALRESEERYRGLVKYAPAAIYEMNLQGTIFLSVNDVLCELLKYSREELLSTRPIDLLDEESQVLFKERIRRKLAGEQIDESIEYRVRRKDGKWIDTIVNVGAITFTDEKPSQVVVIGYDVTERKRIEQALRQSEERFKAIASSTPDHILVQDRELRYTFVVNPQLGLTEQDMLGKTDQDFLTKEDADNLKQIKQHVMETGKSVHVEVPLRPTEGEAQFFDGSYVPKYSADGQIDGLIGYFKNVTALKRIESALRVSEERYRNLFNTMDEGFCIIEMVFDAQERPVDYRFLEVNPAFEKQTGLHEAQGKLMRTLAPEHEAHWFEIYGKVALTGETVHFYNEARQLKRWFEVYAYRLGKPEERHVAIIFNDISVRKQAEEKLQASNDELIRFNKAMVGRELRMVELKNEINELCRRAGLPERYGKGNGGEAI